ncbi:hypothetical protein UFOVP1230_48 [uncultured Caudovirales phage]|uniref:Uncharacterized protein n=1 Tax=uncultured Caudovirales phage TaxID=2100421 RepID=A0A6J5R7Y4_9CAUD|nr:hypothetical protein UFOVP1230_48 [uncultured Caudovirales phage]
MARSIATIKASIVAQKNAETALNGLTSTSQTAIWNVWAYVTAVVINLFEQILDIFKTDVEAMIAVGQSPTKGWWQDRVLKFQYSATDPQVVQLIDYAPQYPVINTVLRIVTRCAIKQSATKTVVIKVAKGISPALAPLTVTELAALSDYVNVIQPAGISVSAISQEADRGEVQAEIFYSGQYVEAVVKAAVIAAIEQYFIDASFSLTVGGIVYINGSTMKPGLIDYIQAVPGVIDIELTMFRVRDFGDPYGSGTVVATSYETTAGYIVAEDEVSHTPNDTITMTLATNG